MKKQFKKLTIALILVICAGLFVACGSNGGKNDLGTGELTLANYNLLKVGEATPADAKSALGTQYITIDQIVSVPIIGESGNLIWTNGEVTVTLQFANGKLLQKVQTGLQ